MFTHPAGKKVNINTLRQAFEKSLERAGIGDFSFAHDLRHTFASRLAQAGVDPYTVQKLMGHKSFSTTQRYAHHYTESLRRGISALEQLRTEGKQESITILSQSQKNRISMSSFETCKALISVGAGGRGRTDMDTRSAGF